MQKAIKKKNRLFRRYKKSKNPEHEQIYKSFRNKLNGLLHNAEKDHYDQLLKKNQNNLKTSWRILKEVINKKKSTSSCSRFRINNRLISDNKSIANGFNSYFVNIGPTLASKIPKDDRSPSLFLKNRNLSSIVLEPVIEDEVKNVIKCLKLSSAGWDSISPCVVKSSYNSFIVPLTHIMNLSISKGVFPTELKVARVIPLFKANDPMSFSNYRPVSVLPLFSKILERLMYKRLLSFINKHEILYDYQFGFRKKFSQILL